MISHTNIDSIEQLTKSVQQMPNLGILIVDLK